LEHCLIEGEIVGAIHFAHAAAAEHRHEAMAAGDDRAWLEATRRRRPRSNGRCRRGGAKVDGSIVRSSSGRLVAGPIVLEEPQ
jgi:hypothetical protein